MISKKLSDFMIPKTEEHKTKRDKE